MKLPTTITCLPEHGVIESSELALNHIIGLTSEGVWAAVLYMDLTKTVDEKVRGEVVTISYCAVGEDWTVAWCSNESVAENATRTEWDSNFVLRNPTVPDDPKDPTYWDNGREDTYVILKLWGDLTDDFIGTLGNLLTIDVL